MVQNQNVFPLSCWNLLRLQKFQTVLSCDGLVLALKSQGAKPLPAVVFSSLSTSLTDRITWSCGTWHCWNQERQFWQYCAECFVGLLGGFPKLPRWCTCSWNNSLISEILTILKDYCDYPVCSLLTKSTIYQLMWALLLLSNFLLLIHWAAEKCKVSKDT